VTRSEQRWVIAAAAILGVAYAVLTPPFEVPDEVFHFWRPLVIAHGQLLPQRHGEPDAGTIPLGAQNLVYVMAQKSGGKYTREQMRVAAQSPPELDRPKMVRFPAWYTPVPYAPQTLAAISMRLFALRPFTVFYLGRLLNLAAALALMALAMRAAPEWGTPVAAVALLPMTLAQCASWSADAMTLALAVLLTALLLAERAPRAAVAAAFVLALCKPAYFLIALLALATRHRKGMKAAIVGASAAGTTLALLYARLGAYNQRIGDPVDAAAQIRCLFAHPTRFLRAVAHDIPAHAGTYVEQLVGRFGGMAQVGLPIAVVAVEIALLIAVGLGAPPSRRLDRRRPAAEPARTPAFLIVIASAAGIFLSQFVIWSVACGDVVEGVQGRYFLPLLPLALAAIALPRPPRRVRAAAVIAVAVACNAVALFRIAWHFW
jgi:uncharacterized membrane protein